MRRNATTGEIQQDFPLNPWFYAKQAPEVRDHILPFLLERGYFSVRGTPEDFHLFCEQVTTNAATLAQQKEERHQQWVRENPQRHQQQQDFRNSRGRGRGNMGRGPFNGRGRNTWPPQQQQPPYGNNQYNPGPTYNPYSRQDIRSQVSTAPTLAIPPASGIPVQVEA
jgi:hypothetical protein